MWNKNRTENVTGDACLHSESNNLTFYSKIAANYLFCISNNETIFEYISEIWTKNKNLKNINLKNFDK